MSEKYTDLTEEIWRTDEGRTSLGSVEMVLDYLDTHPDQVPGRTITESEFLEVADSLNITVVPDPEPTNFERLEDLVDQWRKGPHYKPLTQYLDDCGVKAPGGDDD